MKTKKKIKKLPTSLTLNDVNKVINENSGEIVVPKKLPNPIENFFIKVEGSKEMLHSKELFTGDKSNIDLKTELTDEEIVLINKLVWNNKNLKEHGLPPIWEDFLYNFERLKVSRNRQSRGEFVSINQKSEMKDALNLANNMKNITEPKK